MSIKRFNIKETYRRPLKVTIRAYHV